MSQNHWKVLLIRGLGWWFASFQVICIYFHPKSDNSVEADPVEADPVGSADSDSADSDPVGEDEFAGSDSLILLMLTLLVRTTRLLRLMMLTPLVRMSLLNVMILIPCS